MYSKKYNEDIAVLVHLEPNGYAEKQFNKDREKLTDQLKIIDFRLLHNDCSHHRKSNLSYNTYYLDFTNEKDYSIAFDYLREYFYQMSIKEDFPDEEALPDVYACVI